MTVPIAALDVKPRIPERFKALSDLAHNVWFEWNYEAGDLFRRLSPELWEDTGRNPVALLGRMRQGDLEALESDEGFLAHMDRVVQEFNRYRSEKSNPKIFGDRKKPFTVAYFTMECGVAGCLPVYSGGLGILSGDHLKSASDLNMPVVGISLAYQQGYFRQYLSKEGWQMETYPAIQFTSTPMKLVKNAEGAPLRISLSMRGEQVWIQAWQVDVGRTQLYLLDTNVPENSPWMRDVTSQLYGGDRDMRIRQEIVLGIGGVRMLKAMGIEATVYHMNEGHSAFAAFERIRSLKTESGLSFNEALELVRVTNVFTTHTPVPAGIDLFHPDLMRTYFEDFARSMGISFDVMLGFGRQNPRDRDEPFSMAVLALRLSTWNNAVSRLHGKVSRRMWQKIWPKTPEIDLPIGHTTNGVHIPTWICQGMAEHYNRYLGPRWVEDPDNEKVWERVDKIPDTELWRTHEQARARLVAFCRRRLRDQMARRGFSNRDMAIVDEVLDPEALTIGFARRFAPYKRAHLILRDLGRLERILTNRERPVQIIFSGKAHPQDHMGKELIKHLIEIAERESLRRRVVFLEDYDMEVARNMVQGVDVWLNTPRRPLEACGTSGMKAVANGALHMSVLDGWWDEGYDREIGWAIGRGEEYQDEGFQDDLESRAIYDILEKDVIPLFYDRAADKLPRKWLAMMKLSLRRLCPVFNTHRMVEEYWDRFYLPAALHEARLMGNDREGLKRLAAWREKIMYNWSGVAVKAVRMQQVSELEAGGTFHVEADITLGELAPQDVLVAAYCGRLDHTGRFLDRFEQVMSPVEVFGDRSYKYAGEIEFKEVGRFGINVRITPNHPILENRHSMGLAIWAKE